MAGAQCDLLFAVVLGSVMYDTETSRLVSWMKVEDEPFSGVCKDVAKYLPWEPIEVKEERRSVEKFSVCLSY